MSLQVQAMSRRVKLSSLSLTAGKGPVAMFDAVDFFLVWSLLRLKARLVFNAACSL